MDHGRALSAQNYSRSWRQHTPHTRLSTHTRKELGDPENGQTAAFDTQCSRSHEVRSSRNRIGCIGMHFTSERPMNITSKTSLPLPAFLDVSANQLTIRVATIADLPDVLQLLVDDPISAGRGDFSASGYRSAAAAAFTAIQADPHNVVIVLEREGQLVATMQLTMIPGLSRGGATRLQIEAVHVASGSQSSGFGSAMMKWVIEEAAPALGICIHPVDFGRKSSRCAPVLQAARIRRFTHRLQVHSQSRLRSAANATGSP